MTNTSHIIAQLNELAHTHQTEIDNWFNDFFAKSPPFFYNSVDLRHSGFKLAPVDTNLFPGGFNNLNKNEREQAAKYTANYLHTHYPHVHNILLICEDHTRNSYYLENVLVLQKILEHAGKNVRLSSFHCTTHKSALTLKTQSQSEITLLPMKKAQTQLQTVDGFTPDLVLVNNDLTDGAPEMIKDIEQPVVPPVGFGWYQRRKTSHFETYNHVVRQFANQFQLDPWVISTEFHRCGIVNFKEKKGIECVALGVEKVLHKVRKKYQEYGVTEEPYVFIKSDRGTYGMGIMTARSGDDVYSMGKDIRKKMNTIKGGTTNTEVIIQEGVPTIDNVNDSPAEPMIYMIGGEAVGCMYRLNQRRDAFGNLNASGMQFTSMSDHTQDHTVCSALSLVSKLAAYAAAWECYTESYDI